MTSSREFSFSFVSLFTCFDHFIPVFYYSVGRSMDSNKELFFDTKLFFARSIGT